MDLDCDLPISDGSEDALNRGAIVERLCEIATSVSSEGAFVIGLSGQWGSGKTSILNMAARTIEASKKTYVVRFNPWMISSQEQLVRAFFGELVAGISKNGKSSQESINKVVRLLNDYYQMIGPYCSSTRSMATSLIAPVPVAAAAGNVVTSFLARLLKKADAKTNSTLKSLSELREEINELLYKQFANTVVLIDDMDRLDRKEIRQIFKLVNLTASFPRIVYVLAYDAEVVDRALSDVQGIRGRDYLEKIVQVEIAVPEIPRQDVLTCLISGIEEAIDGYELEIMTMESERERFLAIFDSLIAPVVSTPRRITRFINCLKLNMAKNGGQICATDIAAMTALQMFYPGTAQWIGTCKEEICAGGFRYLPEGEVAADLVEGLQSAARNDGVPYARLLSAIQNLFPNAVRLLTGKSVYGAPSPQAAKAKGRISSIHLLDIFLTEQNRLCITRARVHHVLSCESEEEIFGLMDDAIACNEFNALMHSVQEEVDSLSNSRIDLIARCLIRCFGRAEEVEYSFLAKRGSNELLGSTLRNLFEHLGVEVSSDIVQDAISEFALRDYVGMVYFLRDERLAQDDQRIDRTPCISSSCYEELSRKYAMTVFQNATTIIRSGDIRPISIAKTIGEDSGMPQKRTFEDSLASDVEMRVVYCAGCLARLYGTNGASFSLDGVHVDVELAAVESVLQKSASLALSAPASIRLAALYMLLDDQERDEVREADAEALAKKWLDEAGE